MDTLAIFPLEGFKEDTQDAFKEETSGGMRVASLQASPFCGLP